MKAPYGTASTDETPTATEAFDAMQWLSRYRKTPRARTEEKDKICTLKVRFVRYAYMQTNCCISVDYQPIRTYRCRDCHGSGKHVVSQAKCPSCNGTGTYSSPRWGVAQVGFRFRFAGKTYGFHLPETEVTFGRLSESASSPLPLEAPMSSGSGSKKLKYIRAVRIVERFLDAEEHRNNRVQMEAAEKNTQTLAAEGNALAEKYDKAQEEIADLSNSQTMNEPVQEFLAEAQQTIKKRDWLISDYDRKVKYLSGLPNRKGIHFNRTIGHGEDHHGKKNAA